MSHGLFTIDVLARTDGIQGLGHVQTVRGGDANDIYIWVSQKFRMPPVGLGAGRFSGFFKTIPVGIVDRYDLDLFAGLNQPLHGAHMAAAAPAHSNKTDADAIVGAEHPTARDKGKRGRGTRCHGRLGGSPDEIAAAEFRLPL